MIFINSYSDFCKALELKQSEDAKVRNEAKNALGRLKQIDSALYQEYKEKLENKSKKKKSFSRPSSLEDRQIYLKEHPEIDVDEIRSKLRSSLLRGRYGFGLRLSVPLWMNQEDVMEAFEQLEPAELITGTGKPAPRNTVLQRSIRRAVETGHFVEEKLRQHIISMFDSYYKNKLIALSHPMYVEPVKRMLKEEATANELMKISRSDLTFDIDGLVSLINRKEVKATHKDIRNWENMQRRKAKRKAKKLKQKMSKKSAGDTQTTSN